MRAARILAGSLLAFLLVEVLIFDTNVYPSVLKPDSSAGMLETFLHNERRRKVVNRNQVLAIGDSRMGFIPRYPNKLGDLPYTFATIATPGTTPRCWYYMLRATDPTARRYSAIILPVENYDDAETWEDHADRILDLHFLIARLRWTDIPEFSQSFTRPSSNGTRRSRFCSRAASTRRICRIFFAARSIASKMSSFHDGSRATGITITPGPPTMSPACRSIGPSIR